MDGVVVIDKPAGITSHDVVAVARRALGERRIGHTGTLDPMATGVLPLACGRATRLVRFLSASDKSYVARVRFGVTTDSYDITGAEVTRTDRQPSRESIERGLVSLRGEYDQRPPAYSAKRVGGQRAYDLARRDAPVALEPVRVRVTRADLDGFEGPTATIELTCSAGFYVRTFAHALGELAGTGACLETLRRTRSGEFELGQAITIDLLQDPPTVERAFIPLDRLLPQFPAVRLTEEGRRRVSHGQTVEAPHVAGQLNGTSAAPWVRIFDAGGRLVALGTGGHVTGALHPSVVLI